jgi:hypothetical protein
MDGKACIEVDADALLKKALPLESSKTELFGGAVAKFGSVAKLLFLNGRSRYGMVA